ncbi:MAG: hypothetical protein ACI8TF_003179, partial [Paracoccaceae bacterium]
AERDPKSQRVAQPNNKSWYDTSLPTLHLFQKIKVLRSPVEATRVGCIVQLHWTLAIEQIETCKTKIAAVLAGHDPEALSA